MKSFYTMQYLNAPTGEFYLIQFQEDRMPASPNSNRYKLHRKYSTGELLIQNLWTHSHSHFGGRKGTPSLAQWSTVVAMGVDIECCWLCCRC